MEEKKVQLGVVLEGEMKKRFEAIKRHYGLQKNADLIRLLVTQKCEELGLKIPLPRFEKINSDENGVKIHDRLIGDMVQVYIKPNGITCGYDKTDNCDHVRYALTFPEVRDLIKKHHWKFPDL